jgi:hypothetical protein
VSRFLNSALGYNFTLVPQNLNISASVNASYNYAATLENYTLGPMINATAGFFKKTLTTGATVSYNINLNNDANV